MSYSEQIYDMARSYYNNGYFRSDIRDILEKKKRSKEDDGTLIQYSLECQERSLSRRGKDLSIRDMKETIGKLIGTSLGASRYGQSTVSKDDMTAIYTFITSLPKEFLAEDKSPIGE